MLYQRKANGVPQDIMADDFEMPAENQSMAEPAPAVAAEPVQTAAPVKPCRAASAAPADDKAGLTTKIDKGLHSRLKIHSYRTQIPISKLIEGWIAQFCPPVD